MALVLMVIGLIGLAFAAQRWGVDSTENSDHPEWQRRTWRGFGDAPVAAPAAPVATLPGTAPVVAPAPAARPAVSHRFSQAVAQNSNLELDWLWLATQVTRESERRYCLKRALYINPASEVARRELAQMPALRAAALAPALAQREA